MKAVKALVVFMTLLLVAGLGLLAYGLYSKGGDLAKETRIFTGSPRTFGTQTVILPHDSQVVQWVPVGDTMVMVANSSSGPQLVVLDPAAGRELGRFILRPDAPQPNERPLGAVPQSAPQSAPQNAPQSAPQPGGLPADATH